MTGLFCFLTSQIVGSGFMDALCGADGNAGRRVGMTFAHGASVGVDNKDIGAGRDCRYRAFAFTNTAVGALFADIQ